MQRVDQYPVASEFINKMMTLVIETVKKAYPLKHKLFQANFQDSLEGEAMVNLNTVMTAKNVPSAIVNIKSFLLTVTCPQIHVDACLAYDKDSDILQIIAPLYS